VAHRHAAAIQQVGELAAVCDVDKERAAAFASRAQCKPYSVVSEMLRLEKPHVVAICSPSGLHPAHTVECLKAGADVICEKPMAIDTDSAEMMLNVARQTGRKLFVVKQNRFSPQVMLLKRVADAGILGVIHGFQLTCAWNRGAEYYVQSAWRGSSDQDGGILFTQFSHFIDLLGWLLGQIRDARGWRANFCHGDKIAFEDTGSATLLMESGAIGSIYYTINAQNHNMEGSLAVFGNRGTVKIGGVYLNRMDHFAVDDEIAMQWLKEMPDYPAELHTRVYHELVKALADETHPFVDAAEGMRSVAMIEKIYRGSPLLT
jgi:predicted dehydrogenase